MEYNEKCYVCGETADYHCDDCGRPICDNCVASSSPPEPSLEKSICKACHTGLLEAAAELNSKEQKEDRIQEEIRIKRNRKARKSYWSPQNIEKRKARKEELKKAIEENSRAIFKVLKELIDIEQH